MPVTSIIPMLLRAPAPGPRAKDQRQMVHHRGCGHEDGAQPCGGSLNDSFQFVPPLLLELVGELHDQDAVLRDQTDQRDQPRTSARASSRAVAH